MCKKIEKMQSKLWEIFVGKLFYDTYDTYLLKVPQKKNASTKSTNVL
jgi:hypothetical protein